MALTGYGHKLNFRAGWNAISLCDGSAEDCFPAGGSATAPTCAPLPEGLERWYAQIQSRAGGEAQYFCVRRIPHNGPEPVIGTARWRWVKNDATVWARCVDGCCEVEGRP